MTVNLDELSLRQLQTESARVLVVLGATNNSISKFNKQANHDSQKWYKAVIGWYVEQYGDLPSKTGPGQEVILIQCTNTQK